MFDDVIQVKVHDRIIDKVLKQSILILFSFYFKKFTIFFALYFYLLFQGGWTLELPIVLVFFALFCFDEWASEFWNLIDGVSGKKQWNSENLSNNE